MRPVFAFDTETVDGEPFTLQFAGADGAELFKVSRQTILSKFVELLLRHGCDDELNLLWAHHLEFDLGVVLCAFPKVCCGSTVPLRARVPDGTTLEIAVYSG